MSLEEDMLRNEKILSRLPENIASDAKDVWMMLYQKRCYPDEMVQPFPGEGDFSEFLCLLEDNIDLVGEEFSGKAVIQKTGYLLISSDAVKTRKLMSVYSDNSDLLNIEEGRDIAYAIGNEAVNFGVERDLKTVRIIRKNKKCDFLGDIVRDLQNISFVASWRYMEDIFENNADCYEIVVDALGSAEYSAEEKKEFLKSQPLLFQKDTGIMGYVNKKFSRDYAEVLADEISKGEHETLNECLQSARLKYCSILKEREQSNLNDKYLRIEESLR